MIADTLGPIILALAALLGGSSAALVSDPMPRCAEDQSIIGAGEFEAGRWTRYECGPSVDDYMTPDRLDRMRGAIIADYLTEEAVRSVTITIR